MKYHIAEKKCQIPASDDFTPLEWCLGEIMKHKNEYNYMCPYLTKVVQLILTMSLSNAWPERGASKVKIIKTDLRNRLKNDMLNGLLHIAVNCPELCTEKRDGLVSDAAVKWITAKKRKKLPSSRTSGTGEDSRKTYMEAEVQTESEPVLLVSHGTDVGEEEADDVGSTCDDDHEKDKLFENTLLQLKIAKNLRETEEYRKNFSVDSESDWNSDDEF
ncbi:uncharacterized protein LOC134268468 [Saccostrea cucullata]|uniref:uncharacterized protein LOC134268468 n=1 Tax=Saccostrea cuccullata TaxID=36930 RepID=UPI002ED44780